MKSLRYYCKNLKDRWTNHRNKKLGIILMSIDFIWRKEYRFFLFLIWVLGSFVILCIEQINCGKDWVTPADKISGFIFYSTAIIVFWYSRETHDLKIVQQKELEEVRKQSDFEMRPSLRLQWSKKTNELFQIVNDGRGMAIDIELNNLTIKVIKSELEFSFSIKSRPVISSKGGVTTVYGSDLKEINNKDHTVLNIHTNDYPPLNDDIKEIIERGFEDCSKIEINYSDIEKNKYLAMFKFDENYKDNFKIISQEKIEEDK